MTITSKECEKRTKREIKSFRSFNTLVFGTMNSINAQLIIRFRVSLFTLTIFY